MATRGAIWRRAHAHLNSFDAFTIGVNMTWDDAYKYAKGDEVKLSTTGEPMKKRTPYDFVAIMLMWPVQKMSNLNTHSASLPHPQ